MTFAALLIPVAGVSLGFAAGTAGAASLKITCTTISGTVSGDITVSGCTGGNTGGASEPAPALSLEYGGTTDWVSGSTTTVAAPVTTAVAATKCPGYVHGQTATNPSALSVVSAVTGDTGDGILLPATSTGEVCVTQAGVITALKSFVYSWTASSISCTTITGSATLVVSGCTGGNTGGMSESLSAATLADGGTIDWASGGSTTIGVPTLGTTSATHCPGYVHGVTPEPAAETFEAAVTADTGDGLKLGANEAKGSVCISPLGAITALKTLTVK
jgi:hypothetical protein